MVTPHLDEQMQVRAVTAEDCVVQVAEQASGCNACNTAEGKQAFKARMGDVASGDEKTDRRLPIDAASPAKKRKVETRQKTHAQIADWLTRLYMVSGVSAMMIQSVSI